MMRTNAFGQIVAIPVARSRMTPALILKRSGHVSEKRNKYEDFKY